MIRSIRLTAPDRLQIREGGGWLGAFGLPFLGAGVFMILITFGVIPLSNADSAPAFAWPLLLAMGMVFSAVGGLLVLGRSWVTIDATRRTVTRESGLLVPMRAHAHRLDDSMAVRIAWVRGDSETADDFPVTLASQGGPLVPLCSSTLYAQSRDAATAVARHLCLDIEDATTEHPRRFPASEADLPLQDRARLERRDEEGRRPAAGRFEVSQEDGLTRIVIPTPRAHPVAIAAMWIPVAIVVILMEPLARFFRETRTPDLVAWTFLGFAAVVFGLLPAAMAVNAFVRSRVGRTIVTVSTEGVGILERGAWRTKTIASLPASEILDVDYGTSGSWQTSTRPDAEPGGHSAGASRAGDGQGGEPVEPPAAAIGRFAGRGVTVKTRAELTTVGEGLTDDDLRYLHAVIRRALIGRGAIGPG
jgi:hypothetical protein